MSHRTVLAAPGAAVLQTVQRIALEVHGFHASLLPQAGCSAMSVVLLLGLGLLALYSLALSILASKLVLEDRELSRGVKASRLVAIWLVPLVGAMLSIMVSLEFAVLTNQSRLWRWLAFPFMPRKVDEAGYRQTIDLAQDAENRLPGITTSWPGHDGDQH